MSPRTPPGGQPTPPTPKGSALLGIVLGFLGATAALLVWVGAHAVRASGDTTVRAGLDYETFLGAVDDLIGETGDASLVRFDEVVEVAPSHRRLVYDTMAIVADTARFPSLKPGGFLYDQVQAYNRFQRKRAALGQVDPVWFERLGPYNPSVFRADRRPDGSAGLARAPAAWSLRVNSPLEGEWNGEVRARDVRREEGLVGPRLAFPLSRPVTVRPSMRPEDSPCELVPASDEIRAYCLSEERIAQARFRLEEDGAPSWAVAGWSDLWLDGRRLRPGDSARTSERSVVRLDPLEPLMFADYWEGILSSKQWINGRVRRRSDLAPPLDLFSGLGRASTLDGSSPAPDASLDLSIDAGASADLTSRLQEFLAREVSLPLDFAMVVLARIPSGEILAVGEAGERRNRGRSPILERVAPGSAVKPLLAAAILSQRPELASLTIRARSGQVSSVLGMPAVPRRRAFSTALNCASPPGGQVDLRYFLRCSNNEYAATLLIAGIAESASRTSGGGWRVELPTAGTRVPRSVLLRSALSEGLTELFDLPADPAIADAMGRSTRVWKGLSFSDGSPVQVPRELLPSESRPALLAPGSTDGTDLSLLYRYAYGAWENQWTLLDLTRAFARVVTDESVDLTFARRPPGGRGPGGQGDRLGLSDHDWYRELLGGLQDAAKDGTARGLQSAWLREGLPSLVFAKTGTLNEPGGPGSADDLYSKSLLFALGEPSGGGSGPLACGVAGGIHLRFSEGPASGSLPSVQLEFATARLGEFLREYWRELDGCDR